MAITWNEDLSVGVDLIDEQHKLWFEKANQLYKAGQEGRAKEFIIEMFDFLDDYTKQHFKDEEAYMEKIKYPQIDAQKKAHAAFIADLAKLKKDYNESGGNIVLIINANKMILNWLTQHIRNMDKKIGEYAKTL